MAISEFFRFRKTDPDTSRQAAAQASHAENHFDAIYAALADHGPMGKDQIANRCGLRPDQVWRRLPEMEKIGMIEQTGNVVKSNAGRSEREWRTKREEY